MEKQYWDQLYEDRLRRFAKLVKLKAPKWIIGDSAEGIMLAAKQQSRLQTASSWFKDWLKARLSYTHYQIVRFFRGEAKADEILFGVIHDDEDEEFVRDFFEKNQ